jgi:hypothetical protein
MKTPAQAAANYGANGSSAQAQNNWAANFTAALPKMKARAAAAAPLWQQNVNTAQALARFTKGVQGFDELAAANKANGPSKATFAAQVRAASVGKSLAFYNTFLPAVTTEVQNLDRTNPRGDKAANRARLNAYLDWLDSKAGTFKP